MACTEDVDIEQIKSGIIGNGGDGGVDSIYIFVNSKLVSDDTDIRTLGDQQEPRIDLIIIQSKHEKSFKEGVLKNFVDFLDNCLRFTADLDSVAVKLYKTSLLDVVRRFHQIFKFAITKRPILSVTFYYATLGDGMAPQVSGRVPPLKKHLSECFPKATCDVAMVGAKPLLDWYSILPSRTFTLEYSKHFDNAYPGDAYACLVPLRKFYEFITDKADILQERIFEANVRDYQGDTNVNGEIRASLEVAQKEDFWWLNNGITIISSHIQPHPGCLAITDPLIVNGLQTSFEIFSHFKNVNAEDKRTVLVRVIQNTDLKSIDTIIKATNSQNKIPPFLLHATEDIHRQIENTLKRADFFYDRRKNFYRNQGVSAGKIITVSYLSQALVTLVLHRPDDARGRPTTAAKKHYKRLYSEKHPPELYVKSVQILKRAEEYLDRLDVDRSVKSDVLFYVAWFGTCLAMRSRKPQLRSIATFELNRLTDTVLGNSHTFVMDIYQKYGANNTAAKSPKMLEDLTSELKRRYGR